MKRRITLATLVLLLAGCPDKKGPGESSPAAQAGNTAARGQQGEAEQEHHEELPTKVRLSAKVIEAARIRTAPATTERLPATVDLTGEVVTDPDRSARIAARLPGRVVEVRVKEGDRVKAGQVVAILESAEIAHARAALSSAAARAQSARLNAQRLQNLERRSLASGQEVATAQAEAAALEAELAAARQTVSALGPAGEQRQGGSARLALRSPLAGFVLARDAVRGQSVDAEHVIVVVGDLEHAYFLGRLFEKDLARVKASASAEVRLNAYPQEVFDGKVETIGKQLDPAARTVTARILVRNHQDLLKVGLFGTARVVTGPATGQGKHVVVPLTAVTRVADKDVVFVRQPDGEFEVHPVTVGNSASSRVEILEGLREGEVVVVDGVFTLKSAILKSTFGEEEE